MVIGLGREVAEAWAGRDFPRLEKAIKSRTVPDDGDSLGCRIWVGAKTSHKPEPYGCVRTPDGKNLRVHKIMGIAFAGFFRDLGPDIQVAHSCGKKLCVLPQHLSLVTPRQNILEGFARYALDQRNDELERQLNAQKRPVATHDGTAAEIPLHWQAVNDVDQLRSQGVLLKNALGMVGIQSDAYYRARRKCFPERATGRRRGLERALEQRDAASILAYARKGALIDDAAADSCWTWKGRTTNRRPSAGTQSTHRYIARVVDWSQRGFPGELSRLPDVWRHCENVLCVKPSHLRLIPESESLIDPRLRQQKLDKRADLRSQLETVAPGHPLLTERWGE